MAAAAAAAPGGEAQPREFSRSELQTMLGQCLKLASENKITPHNTWGLPLIEHLPDLIKEERSGDGTNFQRASVTLDAGVKIYSYRVDSVHTETYKMLGGLGRASGPTADDGDGGDDESEEGDVDASHGEGGTQGGRRRRQGQELNPEATLEASLEALNVKKFDLAFAVDPLFHKTSAQFDEGGAKGLLLNNLSVFRGCEIVFDSMDVPEAAVDTADQQHSTAQIDLAGLPLGVLGQLAGDERLSPTLDAILELLGQAPLPRAAAAAEAFVQQVAAASGDVVPTQSLSGLHRPAGVPPPGGDSTGSTMADGLPGQAGAEAMEADAGSGAAEQEGGDLEGVAAEYACAGAVPLADADFCADYDDDDDGGYGGGIDDDASDDGMQQGSGEPAVPFSASKLSKAAGVGGLGDEAIQWLISAAGSGAAGSYVTGSKGWAGASHWRYRTLPPQPAGQGGQGEEQEQSAAGGRGKKRAARRKNDPLDFVVLMEQEEPQFELLAPGAPGGRGGRRRSRQPAKTLLPEDHHYRVEALTRYALRPRAVVSYAAAQQAGGGGGAEGGESGGEAAFNAFGDGFDAGGFASDDDDDDLGGEYDGGWAGGGHLGDVLDPTGAGGEQVELVEAARKVARVEVNYSRAAKQVDVRALKEVMWRGLHVVRPQGATLETTFELQDVLATVPADNPAGRLEDLSVHLCFICLLHLANEHGLALQAVPEMDRLLVTHVPTAA